MGPHVLSDLGPHRQQHTLSLVVTGTVLVGSTEVSGHDGSVDGADYLAERYLVGRASEDVASPDPAFGAHQAGAFESQQDLLQVGLWQAGSLGEVAN